MRNIILAVKAFRWNMQMDAAKIAAEIGITTKEYNRFEQGQEVSAAVERRILCWLINDPEPVKKEAA